MMVMHLNSRQLLANARNVTIMHIIDLKFNMVRIVNSTTAGQDAVGVLELGFG